MKKSKLATLLGVLILVATLFGCAPQPNGAPASPNATSEQSVGAYTQEMTDDAAMNPADETDKFLIDAVAYCTGELGMDKADLLLELANGIIGDQYPSPSRCLTCTEGILNDYLQSTLYGGADLKGKTQVFPTEGGTAAMTYVFQSLSHNRVLKPGDKIAIGTPIFTPYLQIPHVNDYGLVSVDVTSTVQDGWDIAPEELDKLKDPNIKAFFLVNPSNPASHALSDKNP